MVYAKENNSYLNGKTRSVTTALFHERRGGVEFGDTWFLQYITLKLNGASYVTVSIIYLIRIYECA
jgi:hypothetical protein